MHKNFWILNGNNGATYIINTKSWETISVSLNFYQARSVKAKVLKSGLHFFLWFIGRFPNKKLKNIEECQAFLKTLTPFDIDFELDANCSVLVSPTRDKVIVNHHGSYFQKFAFGRSYEKVKNEAAIYTLFNKTPLYFQISRLEDFYDATNEYCTFKLSNEKIKNEESSNKSLSTVLVEFFNSSNTKEIDLTVYLDLQIDKLSKHKSEEFSSLQNHLLNLKTTCTSINIPLGLVHNDFKPWNIINYDKILIFDFEEASLNGMPLFDLFNFYCDPIVRYKTPKKVIESVFNERIRKNYDEYSNLLGIKVNINSMFDLYLIDRILFWQEAMEETTVLSYINLFNFIHSNE